MFPSVTVKINWSLQHSYLGHAPSHSGGSSRHLFCLLGDYRGACGTGVCEGLVLDGIGYAGSLYPKCSINTFLPPPPPGQGQGTLIAGADFTQLSK